MSDNKPWITEVFSSGPVMSILVPYLDTLTLIRLLSATSPRLRQRFAVNHSPTGHIVGIRGDAKIKAQQTGLEWRKLFDLKRRIKDTYDIDVMESETRNPLRKFLDLVSRYSEVPGTEKSKFLCFSCHKFSMGSHLVHSRLSPRRHICKACALCYGMYDLKYALAHHTGAVAHDKQFLKFMRERKKKKIKELPPRLNKDWQVFAELRGLDRDTMSHSFDMYATLNCENGKVFHFDDSNLSQCFSKHQKMRYWYLPDLERFAEYMVNMWFREFCEKHNVKAKGEKTQRMKNAVDDDEDHNSMNKKKIKRKK